MSRSPRDIRAVTPAGGSADDGRPASGAPRVYTDTHDHALVQQRLGLAYLIFACVVLGLYVVAALFVALLRPQLFWSLQL